MAYQIGEMNSKLLSLAAIAALAIGFAATGAQAQSAKFAASYDNDVVSVKAVYSTSLVCSGTGGTNTTPTVPVLGECVNAEVDMATIQVAQDKDLLIGISSQIGLITITEAKGKTGTATTKAVAEGEVEVLVTLENVDGVSPIIEAAPGNVIMAARLQELSVGSGTEEEVVVKLKLSTTAAHHFNFLGINVPQGTYKVVASYDLSAFADVIGTGGGSAEAEVILGKRVVAVQAVRAAKGGIIEDVD